MDFSNIEYSTSEIQKLLQKIFPTRKLVLSQFTFYTQCGVANPTGETFKRGRRCYKIFDILSIACVLELKEQGIALKNLANAPQMLQAKAEKIFALGQNCKLSGCGEVIDLLIPGEKFEGPTALENMLNNSNSSYLYWSLDVSSIANKIMEMAIEEATFEERRVFAA